MKKLLKPFIFKTIIKDTSNFHSYYNNLLTRKKLSNIILSPSKTSLFISNFEENTKDNKYSNEKKGTYASPKIDLKINSIFDNIISNKIKLKPISKRDFIYQQILKSNSCLTLNVKKIKKIKLKNSKSLDLMHKLNENKNTCDIKYFNDWEKLFFVDNDYSFLKYNEKEIYKSKIIYDNIIKEKIDYFKKNKNKNLTINLEKNLSFGKYKKNINLVFNSLIITFKDMSLPKNFNEKNINIEFPFALLPIFYYKGYHAFIKFLSVVIKIENNFQKIIFNESKISEALNDLLDFDNEKKYEKDDNSDDYDFDFLSLKDLDEENFIEIKAPSLKRKKNHLNFNYFIFYWITNIKTFIVTISLPCIHLNILENNICINHFIDYELLFFLYNRNFLNWEYYIINNLLSYSKFRNIFLKIESTSKILNENFFLKEPKTRINTFSEELLINIYSDSLNQNQIIQFESFYVIIHFFNINFFQEKTYHVYFNFIQYVKLFQISKYLSKLSFLVNFLDIDNELNTLNFNFKKYDTFDVENWLYNIEKFSGEKLKERDIKDDDLIKEFEIYSSSIKLQFKRPKWSIIKLEKKDEIKKSYLIGKDMENDLIDCILESTSDSWTNFLNKCLKKIEENIPNLSISRKKYRKKGNRNNVSSPVSRRIKFRTRSYYSNI